MEREWALAAFPLERSVLKLRLRPYSCGHEILLARLASPFVVGGSVTLSDLRIAVLICSQSFSDGFKLIHQPNIVRLFLAAWRLILMISRVDQTKELDRFLEYLKAGRWFPETYDMSRSPGWAIRRLKAPRVYRLIPLLCSELGLTEAEALDVPMARANAYAAAKSDRDGSIDLKGGEEEDALLKHLAELEARAEKGENVWGS